MKFGLPQLARFKAKAGAYSPVTPREFEDSQITATDAETELLETHFGKLGETIYWGNVTSGGAAALKEFRLFPTGEKINLNLVYPKTLKTELRLYISIRRGFKPESGDIWFMYEDCNDDLWIGALKEKEWRTLFAPGMVDDDETEEVAQVVQPMTTTTQAVVPVQDPDLIQKRMELSKYTCEYDKSHQLFVARATGCRYVEVHHIIPKKYLAEFWTQRHKDLTKLDNLCSLCPSCHRAIHHGEEPVARKILDRLYDLRSIQRHYGITKRELHQLYSVEEIVKED
jgi:5-methylcytosine-specific restriction endonuclease McrA